MTLCAPLFELCRSCEGRGAVPSKVQVIPGAVKFERCDHCGGAGKIALRERLFDGSPTHESLMRQIKDLQFELKMATESIHLLRAENQWLRAELEKGRKV